jgi:hypothetical protein
MRSLRYGANGEEETYDEDDEPVEEELVDADTTVEERDDRPADDLYVEADNRLAVLNESSMLVDLEKLGRTMLFRRGWVLFSGFALAVLATFLLVLTPTGFYAFVPGIFFTEFASVFAIPIVLQFILPLFLFVTQTIQLRFAIFIYACFCGVVALFMLASSLYGTYAAASSNFSGPLISSIGIYVAMVLCLLIAIFELVHIIFAVMLMPARDWCCGKLELRDL